MRVLPALCLGMKRAASFVRLRPFDISTTEGRGQERHRRAVLTFLVSAVARTISVSTVLISIPLCLSYLGTERFGMWMTLSSIVALLGFADLGIGNGLLNAVSEAHGRADPAAIRRYISSALFTLTAISGALLVGIFLIGGSVNWASAFKVKTPTAIVELPRTLVVFSICFALNIPLGVVQRVQSGLQHGYVAGLWQALGSMFGFLAVLGVIHWDGGLPWLVLAFMVPPLGTAILNGIVYFTAIRPDLRFRTRDVTREAMTKVAHTGLLFLVLQIALATAVYSDNFLISTMLGADSVIRYAVPARMFALIGLGLSSAMAPLWPAYGEATARRDAQWIGTTLRRSLIVSFVASLLSASLLIFLGRKILWIWVGPAVSTSFGLMIGLGVWSVLEATGNALAMFLNGLNVVRTQVITATAFAVICITLKILLLPRVGVTGIVWGNIIAYSLTTAIPYMLITPRLLGSESLGRS